jgi:hypothetical protein
LAILLSYLTSTIVATAFLPLWPALGFGILCWIASLGLLCYRRRPGSPQLIWRYPGKKKVRALNMVTLILGIETLFMLVSLMLVIASAGNRIWQLPGNDTSMPLTNMIGSWVAWLLPGMMLTIGAFIFVAWRDNPGRQVRPTLFVDRVPETVQSKLRLKIWQRGWMPFFDHRDDDDVCLKIVPPDQSQVREFDPKWPLEVALIDLDEPLIFERIARRNEIQLRRRWTKGMTQLFKGVDKDDDVPGAGVWFAPHLWFIPGLTRDEVTRGEDDPYFINEIISYPYADVFSIAVRRYMNHLLRRAQVDLFFVEDGVSTKQLVKITRMLFDLVDKTNGQTRINDYHFKNLTKVKVIFHDFDVDEPFESMNYPEPKFAPIGRLRVMHIFKDRGAHEEPLETPRDHEGSPIPLLVG